MRRAALKRLRSNQDGLILVEIVVSAMLLVIVALGVFTAFDAGTRATAEERHRARAHSLAEADVERMRAMRVADLGGLDQTRTITVDGLSYTIRSQGSFGTEPATTNTCAAGTGSRDLLQVTSTVTWASIGSRPPVSISSVVAPPNGSIVPNSGSLLVSVKDSRSNGMPGVALSGSGASSFSGTTGPGGCVLWRNITQGNYSLSFGAAASGKVDPDGAFPTAQTVSVVAGSTNTVNYQFDSPGRIQDVRFRTRDYDNNLDFMTWDSMVVDQTGMTTARVFASAGGRVLTMSTPQTLFPFTSPYSVYAGTCGDNNPGGGGALGSAMVPVGGAVTGPTLQLPSLQVHVWDGSTNNSNNLLDGARVTAEDTDCNIRRTLTTSTVDGRVPDDASGRPMIGLPYGTYNVCAQNAAGTDRRIVTNVQLTSVGSSGTDLDINLRNQPSGTCPP